MKRALQAPDGRNADQVQMIIVTNKNARRYNRMWVNQHDHLWEVNGADLFCLRLTTTLQVAQK